MDEQNCDSGDEPADQDDEPADQDDPEDIADKEEPLTPQHQPPEISLTAALHMAGHEVEDLGLQDVPDTGEVLYATEERERKLRHPGDHVEGDIATRGQGG